MAHGLAGITIVATPVENLKSTSPLFRLFYINSDEIPSQVTVTDTKICRRPPVSGTAGLYTANSANARRFRVVEWLHGKHSIPDQLFLDVLVGRGTSTFLAGGLGSLVFWIMSIPADNTKNRMMAYPYPAPYSAPPGGKFGVPSFATTVRTTYLREGVSGFYRGLGPCILRAFPVNACAYFVYEGILRGLGAEKTRH
ncbi:mitochondrial carrier protein [Moniliophthora roreri]|nr:mitochondrial carrier protein [Moniliophthora roreri]